MEKIWYLSPACAAGEDPARQLYLLIYEITDHLDRAGVSFHVPERPLVLPVGHISNRRTAAEAIAKYIIRAEGKEFVPMTRGEWLEQAISLGLFSRDTRWSAPMTKEDAAILAAKLIALTERG